MKYIFIFLILFVNIFLFIHILGFLSNKQLLKESFTVNDNCTDIGNCLSSYYYALILSILEKKDFIFHSKFNYNFLKHLPQYIKFDNNIYDSFIKNNITIDNVYNDLPVYDDLAFWCINKNSLIIVSEIMKPLMNKIIHEALQKESLFKIIDTTIIHFRCADTPFVKHPMYHFQKYNFFTDMLNRNILPNKNIILLSFTKHKSNEDSQLACEKYSLSLKKYLEQHNYNVTIKSETDGEDFATMFYAPLVISTISSFCFFAGFFGNGKYYQPTCWTQDNTEICDNCNENIVLKGYNLLHYEVDDYLNTEKVINLLNK